MDDSLVKNQYKPIFSLSDNIISSIGFTTADNVRQISNERPGIECVEAGRFSHRTLPFALVDHTVFDERADAFSIPRRYTRLERMMLLSASDALRSAEFDVAGSRTVFVVSTTKGNIDRLSLNQPAHLQPALWVLGEHIREFFGNPNQAMVVSNACVSGVLAVEIAARMLRGGLYDHAVVIGGDLVSRFVVSGFESFQALSDQPCRPYDAVRNGLTLGEGCATMVLSIHPPVGHNHGLVTISGGASSNDATHISAPDRTGTGLSLAIGHAFEYSGLQAEDIDAVCAHGTATVYNDEMESQAMLRANLTDKPIYSLKGYWGHTLGAAGLMETVSVVQSLKQQRLFRTFGYESPGTSIKLRVTTQTQDARLRHVLKTASGFGGCNTALVVSKIDD